MGSIDIDTIQACQRGDAAAAMRIYDALHGKVYALAYRYTNDQDRAQDLAQEAFVRIFTRIGSFRCESSLSTWAYRVTVNTILSELRRDRPYQGLPEQLAETRSSAKPEPQLAREELGEQIAQAVNELPDSLRIAFVLVAMEGLAYAEVAEILAVSVEAVRMRMSRARARLRKRLRPYLAGGSHDGM
ncbi:MAG: RNA polymerase sigma factor [Anaerolineae bacterium]